MAYPYVNIILGWLDFQALISEQRSSQISCEQEQDDAPHVNNIWASGVCKRCFTLSSFSSHSSIFRTRKGYKWALWDPSALACSAFQTFQFDVSSAEFRDAVQWKWNLPHFWPAWRNMEPTPFHSWQSEEPCCFRQWFPWMSSVLTPWA